MMLGFSISELCASALQFDKYLAERAGGEAVAA
jgi:hypothetical protein